jgi:hypothetical protein
MNILDINEIIWYGDRLPNDSNNNRIYKLRFWCAIVNGVPRITKPYKWPEE